MWTGPHTGHSREWPVWRPESFFKLISVPDFVVGFLKNCDWMCWFLCDFFLLWNCRNLVQKQSAPLLLTCVGKYDGFTLFKLSERMFIFLLLWSHHTGRMMCHIVCKYATTLHFHGNRRCFCGNRRWWLPCKINIQHCQLSAEKSADLKIHCRSNEIMWDLTYFTELPDATQNWAFQEVLTQYTSTLNAISFLASTLFSFLFSVKTTNINKTKPQNEPKNPHSTPVQVCFFTWWCQLTKINKQ